MTPAVGHVPLSEKRLAAASLWAILLLGLGLGAIAPARSSAAPDERAVHVGQSAADTLLATRSEAYRAAAFALRGDGWTLAGDAVDSSRIITEWKSLHHPLVRLFGGDVQARCVVRLTPIGTDRTAVSIQGGLVMGRGMSESPLMAFADRAYDSEARIYLTKVRKELSRGRLALARAGL